MAVEIMCYLVFSALEMLVIFCLLGVYIQTSEYGDILPKDQKEMFFSICHLS